MLGLCSHNTFSLECCNSSRPSEPTYSCPKVHLKIFLLYEVIYEPPALSPTPGVTSEATINQQVSKQEGIYWPLLPTAWRTHSVLTFGWTCSLSSHCLHLPAVVIPWQLFLECPPHTWLSVRGWGKGELETHSLPSWSLPILFTSRNSRFSSHATTYVKSFPLFEVAGC